MPCAVNISYWVFNFISKYNLVYLSFKVFHNLRRKGTIRVQLFLQLGSPTPEMVQQYYSKPRLNFFKSFFWAVSKFADFYADFESVEKVAEQFMRKSYALKSLLACLTFSTVCKSFRPATFLGELFCYVFNGFEISVNFCGFDTHWFTKIVSFTSTFLKLWSSISYLILTFIQIVNEIWPLVGASDSQSRSRNCPGFDLSILRHSRIWGWSSVK
jgi:hypothetical protein